MPAIHPAKSPKAITSRRPALAFAARHTERLSVPSFIAPKRPFNPLPTPDSLGTA